MIAKRALNRSACDLCEGRNGILLTKRSICICQSCVIELHQTVRELTADTPLTTFGDVRAADPDTLFRPHLRSA